MPLAYALPPSQTKMTETAWKFQQATRSLVRRLCNRNEDTNSLITASGRKKNSAALQNAIMQHDHAYIHVSSGIAKNKNPKNYGAGLRGL
jgi:hypothetical protein